MLCGFVPSRTKTILPGHPSVSRNYRFLKKKKRKKIYLTHVNTCQAIKILQCLKLLSCTRVDRSLGFIFQIFWHIFLCLQSPGGTERLTVFESGSNNVITDVTAACQLSSQCKVQPVGFRGRGGGQSLLRGFINVLEVTLVSLIVYRAERNWCIYFN